MQFALNQNQWWKKSGSIIKLKLFKYYVWFEWISLNNLNIEGKYYTIENYLWIVFTEYIYFVLCDMVSEESDFIDFFSSKKSTCKNEYFLHWKL